MFGIDLRSLALFRIGIGIVLLFDIAIRATALEAHYTDSGVMPRSAVIDNLLSPSNFCLHLITGTVYGQALLFIAAATFALLFIVGCYTRIATVASWLLLVSVQLRNPMILQGGDILIRSLFFWAMFLPLGDRLSVDSRGASRAGSTFSVASLALLLQVALMYGVTAALKNGSDWIPDGLAIHYALNIETFAKPAAVWLRQFPQLLHLMTYAVWWGEAIGPLTWFIPLGLVYWRVFGILSFWALHIGLFSCMELGIFPFVSSVAMLPFIPSELWDWLGVKCRRQVTASWIANGNRIIASMIPTFAWELNVRFLGTSRTTSNFFRDAVVSEKFHDVKRSGITVVKEIFCTVILSYVIWWNISGIPAAKTMVPENLRWIAGVFRLDQYWDMFAPYPSREDGWWVTPGKLEDGTEVDVRHEESKRVSWEAPPLISADYQNDRWRSYHLMLWLTDYEKFRPMYGEYLCRLWNRNPSSPGKRLASFEVYYMNAPVPEIGHPRSLGKVLLWEQTCN